MVMMVIAMKLTMMNMAIMIMILKAVIKLMMMMKRRTTMMMMIGLPLRVPSRSLGFRAWDLDN